MELSANYIKRIEIDGLWDRFNIVWDLRPMSIYYPESMELEKPLS